MKQSNSPIDSIIPLKARHNSKHAQSWSVGALLLVMLLWAAATPMKRAHAEEATGTVEVCRIRIENRAGGEVSVSPDNGHTYSVVGHVLIPAEFLILGFSATEWAQEGTVCATAVHGIRICSGHHLVNGSSRGKIFSVVPREYKDLPDSFGGQRSGGAGIYTDIAAATSIFRNLAPFVGNPVLLEHDSILQNMPKDYEPHIGDVLVIEVERPAQLPEEIDFSNRKGGPVEEVFASGERLTVAQVVQPVYGIGRYDATSYTGVGMINTNHPGVITVSTAPGSGVDISDEERGWERRGGFQIEPAIHAEEFHSPPPSIMVVGPRPGDNRGLEGTPPLFSGLIGLQNTPGNPANSFRVQVKIDGGAWEAMPELIGSDPLLFTAARLQQFFADHGAHRSIQQGVTDFRIVFPHLEPNFATDQVRLAVNGAARGNINLGNLNDVDALVRGEIKVNVNLPGDDAQMKYVAFIVDGELRGYSNANTRPYAFAWDTRLESNGHHVITVRGEDPSGQVLTTATSTVIVSNVLGGNLVVQTKAGGKVVSNAGAPPFDRPPAGGTVAANPIPPALDKKPD